MRSSDIVIVTPALADANNGNWQTARRWADMLSQAYRVRLAAGWDGGDEALMIALHARRSAASVTQWRALRPRAALVVVLTGTDLYRDIVHDANAQASMRSADRLVVLNELGGRSVPAALQAKVQVILQSCAARQTQSKTVRHLRAEKSPQTYFDAVRRLAHRGDILFDHVGAALEPELGVQARSLMSTCPHYRWLGPLPHESARRRIQAAHVVVHPSRMEGGAHVVIEAVRSGTPVLASRIDGNVGLLGELYEGYFPLDDDGALATLLQRLRDDPAMLVRLQQQCEARAALFDPARERKSLLDLSAGLLTSPPSMDPHERT